MKFEIENGNFVGTAEWEAPGRVALDMEDEGQREWFERYFTQETSAMEGPVDCADMSHERRDSSPEAFQRAAFDLAAYAYKVRTHSGSMRSDGAG